MDKYKKLLTDTGLFIVSNFASKILIFLLLPLYTNVLSTEEYAVADLITMTINLIFPILTFSITEATLRFALDKEVKKNEVLSTAVIFIVISAILVICARPLVAHISSTLDQYWWYFVACYCVTSVYNTLSYFSRGCDKTKEFAISGLIHSIVLIGCNFLFLIGLRWGLKGYLLSMVCAYLIASLYIFLFAQFYKDLFHFRINLYLIMDMLKYSIPMIPTIIAWWVMQTSDKYMIIWKLGLGQSGIYSVSYKIPSVLTIVSTLFTQAWQISAISNYGEEDHSSFVSTIYEMFNVVSVIACAVVVALSKVIGSIMFANDYFVAWRCVPILLIAYVFSGLSGFLASNFTAAKKTSFLFVSTSVGAMLNVVLNLFVIKRFGIIGAAYTTMIGFFVTWVIRLVVSRKFVKIKVAGLRHGLMYAILLLEAVYMYKELPLYYVVTTILIVVLLIINLKEISNCIRFLLSMLRCRNAKNEENCNE